MPHDHGHHGHSHSHAPPSFNRAFAIGIALNLAYVVGEIAFGVASDSLALLADAGHNAGDVLGLGAAWLAAWLSTRAPRGRFTYGLRGSSILAALGNAIVLLLATGAIAWEAIQRLIAPLPVAGATIMAVAAAGIFVNGVTAWLFARGRHEDLNRRGAFLHMAADALVSLGTVVAGALILWTGWTWIDPAVSLAVAAVIVAGTWGLLQESLGLAMAAVPPGIDRHAVAAYLCTLPGVTSVHDLHIWGMSTTETALTAHLVHPGGCLDDATLSTAAEALRARFGICHATLQVETGDPAHPCALAPEEVV